jgi:hypothetical protein
MSKRAARSLGEFLGQWRAIATRPKMYCGETMPESVELVVGVPAGASTGTRDEFIAAVAAGVAVVESRCSEERRLSGRGIVGRRSVLRQSPFAVPTSAAPRRQLSPRVKCSNKWHRIEALTRNRAFVEAHRAARVRWLAGLLPDFPAGTWALRHLVAPDARPPPADRARSFASIEL